VEGEGSVIDDVIALTITGLCLALWFYIVGNRGDKA
jgi:hypothetical protein